MQTQGAPATLHLVLQPRPTHHVTWAEDTAGTSGLRKHILRRLELVERADLAAECPSDAVNRRVSLGGQRAHEQEEE